jgi:hypothetical protein
MNEDEKYAFLKEFIKNESAINELLIYSKNKFINTTTTTTTNVSLEDTYINTWKKYYKESKQVAAFDTLKKYIVQLQYPVKKGISKTDSYINSTLRGKHTKSNLSLVLNQPELITLDIYHSSLSGKVPVVTIPNNDDFNTFISAISNKNEPQKLPKSMGALCINGINNWDRIQRLKVDWLKQNQKENWSLYFKEHILPKSYLFKDKLMVLSTKPYSGITHALLNVTKDTWKCLSLKIRREHECAHLFTLKHYGCMANNMHDEVIADYAGIVEASGNFNRTWFLYFIGLENYPKYRKGGRLENYLGTNKLSIEAFEGLKKIIYDVSDTIYNFDVLLGKVKSTTDQLNRIKSICEVDLITMASMSGCKKLLEKYKSIKDITIE